MKYTGINNSHNYISTIKNRCLDKFPILKDKIYSEDFALLVREEKSDKEYFIVRKDKRFLLVDSDFEIIDDKVKESFVNKHIGNASFEDIYSVKKETNEKGVVLSSLDTNPYYEEDSVLLEDYLEYSNVAKQDLSSGQIFDKYYKFTFAYDDENGSEIEESFLIIPELQFFEGNVLNGTNHKVYGENTPFASRLNSSVGCVIIKVDGNSLDLKNAESMSLDELNLMITEMQRLGKFSDCEFTDSKAMKLFKNYIVENEGNISNVAIRTNGIYEDVSFYIEAIDEFTEKYVVEIQGETYSFSSLDEFISNDKVKTLLDASADKVTDYTSQFLNYEIIKEALTKKVLENERDFINVLKDEDSFLNDDSDYMLLVQYIPCSLSSVSLERLGLPVTDLNGVSKVGESDFERFLQRKSQNIDRLSELHNLPSSFLGYVLESNENIIHLSKKPNQKLSESEIFENINTLYGLYNLDSTELKESILDILETYEVKEGVFKRSKESHEEMMGAIRDILVDDFDSKYWESRIEYLSTPRKNDLGEDCYLPYIQGMSKEEALTVFMELSFERHYKAFLDEENNVVNLDKLFKDNQLIYQDLTSPEVEDFSSISKDLKKDTVKILGSSYAEMDYPSDIFSKYTRFLKVKLEDLNDTVLRNSFDEIVEGNEDKIIISYIQSSVRFPDDSYELKTLIRNYEQNLETNGEDYALANLKLHLRKKTLDELNESNNAEYLYEQNSKNLNSFVEVSNQDFSTIMRKVISNLDVYDDNFLSFEFKNCYGIETPCTITKKDNDLYTLSLDTGKGIKDFDYNLNGLIATLNYTNSSGLKLIPDEEKEVLRKTFRNRSLDLSTGEILESNYSDAKIDKTKDTTATQINKILGQGDSVILRSNTRMWGQPQFYLLQKTDDGNKVILKSIEVLESNKRAANFSTANFGNQNTAVFDEYSVGKEVVRDYYLNGQARVSTENLSPDVRIRTQELTSKDLDAFVNGLYLRTWDIERSDYRVPEIGMYDGYGRALEGPGKFSEVSVLADKDVFSMARQSSMTVEEKREYILNEKIINNLSSSAEHPLASCVYVNMNKKVVTVNIDDEERDVEVVKKQVITIQEGLDLPNGTKTYDINVIDYSCSNGVETPVVTTMKGALYQTVDSNGERILKVSSSQLHSVNRVLDSIFENKLDTKACSNFFLKESAAERVDILNSYVDTFKNYGKHDQALQFLTDINLSKYQIGYDVSLYDAVVNNERSKITKSTIKDILSEDSLQGLISQFKSDPKVQEGMKAIKEEDKDIYILRGICSIANSYEKGLNIMRGQSVESILIQSGITSKDDLSQKLKMEKVNGNDSYCVDISPEEMDGIKVIVGLQSDNNIPSSNLQVIEDTVDAMEMDFK